MSFGEEVFGGGFCFGVVEAEAGESADDGAGADGAVGVWCRRWRGSGLAAYLRKAHSGAVVVNSAMMTLMPLAAARSIMRS